MNDLLIRWYAGGNHDSAGMGWCWLMFHVGLVIAVTIMIVFSFENKSKKFVNSSIVVIGAVISAVFYNFVNSTI
jgi:membrane protein YdbS with pleckstrin-like domain